MQYCAHCGNRYTSFDWPRLCTNCNRESYRNPIPVSVALIPYQEKNRTGLVVITRNIEPQKGKRALPGGFVEYGETGEEAAAREAKEEAGIDILPSALELFMARSNSDKSHIILLYMLKEPITLLPPFQPNKECSERSIIYAPTELAFPLHSEAVFQFWEGLK